MPASSSPQPLFHIDECSYLMTDTCIRGEQGNLIFLSVWARDTAAQQFLARLTLGHDEDGMDIITEPGSTAPVFVHSVVRLEKRFTSSFRRTLFGLLVNLCVVAAHVLRLATLRRACIMIAWPGVCRRCRRIWPNVSASTTRNACAVWPQS